MESPYRYFKLYILVLSLFTFFLLSHSAFAPIDNYLIDCGSTVDTSKDNRRFVADLASSDSYLFPSTGSISLRNEYPFAGIYDTARVFTKPTKYEFTIKDKGTHMVRLHFHNLNSSKLDLLNDRFHVLVNGYLVLSNFGGGNTLNRKVKDFLIWVDDGKLSVTFFPAENSKFAFVNAIEVISAPKDLLRDTAQLLNSEKSENFNGLTKQAFEVVYRINVGGPKVTEFNDTLWRTWVPDDQYLESNFGLKRMYCGGRIKYQLGGASREVGPDNVYNTARFIQSVNSSIPKINMTWVFPVVGGYKYLVRLHFCDIASISLGFLYFNVYVNGYLAYKDFDLSRVANWMLASPFYADFVVDVDGNPSALIVNIEPSNKSLPHAVDGILNGIEIMKMNNSMGSLDGKLCVDLLTRNLQKGKVGVLVPLIAALCLVLALITIMPRIRRVFRANESLGWSKLPMDHQMSSQHGK